jgi:hypothetical protein
LDLSQTSNEDLEALAQKIEGFYKNDSSVKSALSYHWDRTHLMLDGKQWITYSQGGAQGGQWSVLKVSAENEYIPRPVTNYMYDIYQTLKSYLIQNKPRSTVIPNTQKNKDKQAAKLAELVCEVNWKRLLEEKNYEYAAACGVAYGTVFKKSYWDTSSLQTAKIPRLAPQPVIEPNTGAVIGYEDREVVDPETGETVFDELPLGDVNTAVVEPQRLALDPLATDLHNARWVMEYAIQPLDWIREVYDRQEPGYTGLAAEVKEEGALSNTLQRWYQLKNSSGVKMGATSPTQSGSDMIENSAVVKEYYERPSRKYPHGRLVVVANGITLYAGDSPYGGADLGDWHPYSEFRWEVIPGRFWGKSPLDDTAEIQKHINSTDAAIILTRKTMAVPQKLIPASSGIKPGEWTGRPGQEIRFRESGATPSIIPGVGVDQTVFQERQQRLEDMKNISGAIDILKGDRPPGVTAASALEMLFEVGTGKLRPCLDRWKVFVEGDQKKQLKWTARFFKEPRPDFIQKLKQLNSDLPESVIEEFIGADIRDNANVKIEAGSNIPKLQSAEKANLIQMAQIGTLNLETPENQMEFNHRMGVVGFDSRRAPDVERAEWENDLLNDIEESPDNVPTVLAREDHGIHIEIHLQRQKEPSYSKCSAAVMQAYEAHIAEHEQYQNQILMQQQMEAALTGQPPQQMPGGPPVPETSQGKGLDAETQQKINTPDFAGKATTA